MKKTSTPNASFFRLFMYLCLLGALWTAGLPAVLEAAGEVPEVSVEFSAISLGKGVRGLTYDTRQQAQHIFIPNASRSASVRYVGAPELVFYVPETGPDGLALKRTVATVNLEPYNGRRVLLTFAQEPGQERWRVFVLDDSFDNFQGNSWRVFNLIGSPLAIKTPGNAPRTIMPGRQQTFLSSSDKPVGETVQIGIEQDGEWRLVYSSIWGRNPRLRSLFFALPAPNGKGLIVRQINQSTERMREVAQER